MASFRPGLTSILRIPANVLPSAPTNAPSDALLQALQPAVTLLGAHEPVAIPTETVYGLAADATNPDAIQRIFQAKGRPSDNPLIVHVSTFDSIQRHILPDGVPFPEVYRDMCERFWPGPLTILLPVDPAKIPSQVTAGLKTVGVRIPAHPVALALIHAFGKPLAAPSANTSSRPSPTTAAHVLQDLQGRIGMIVDGGECTVGVESTVVDGLDGRRRILRPGGVGVDQIRACQSWDRVSVTSDIKPSMLDADGGAAMEEAFKAALQRQREISRDGSLFDAAAAATTVDGQSVEDATPMAPGMKYRHYSPRAPVILVEAHHSGSSIPPSELTRTLESELAILRKTGHRRVGFLHPTTIPSPLATTVPLDSSQDQVLDVSLGATAEDTARMLFGKLREMDDVAVDAVVVCVEAGSDVTGKGIGTAVVNRLRKAALRRVVVGK